MAQQAHRKKWLGFTAGIALWATLVASGFAFLEVYKGRPGSAGAPPERWPATSGIVSAEGQSNLVLAAHPHCPCTRATIAELAKVMTHSQDRVSAHVLFLRPAHVPPNWERTDLWYKAGAIPGVKVMADEQGKIAARFGARTSGQVALYNSEGQLVFSGGITRSRGHEGENAGRDAVIAILTEEAAKAAKTPVFGCPLCRYNQATQAGRPDDRPN